MFSLLHIFENSCIIMYKYIFFVRTICVTLSIVSSLWLAKKFSLLFFLDQSKNTNKNYTQNGKCSIFSLCVFIKTHSYNKKSTALNWHTWNYEIITLHTQMITTQPVLGGMLFSRMLTLTILNNNESRLNHITFSVPYLLPTPDLSYHNHFQLFTYLWINLIGIITITKKHN